MSNLFSGINARLRGASSKQGSGKSPVSPTSDDGRLNSPRGLSQRSKSSSNLRSQPPSLPDSPSPSLALSATATGDEILNSYRLPKPLPMWLNPAYAKHIVKGNFMTLSSRPKTVELVVEHYRNLWTFVQVICAKEADGKSICNATTCPRMSAGPNQSYTWLNKNFEPTEVAAVDYIALMQRWISAKIDDLSIFPTDPAGVSFAHNPSIANTALLSGPDEWIGKRSGFPKQFAGTCQGIFLQMFRVYVHLYWAHFVEPFYHLNLEKQLNSCFSHFLLTATALDMLKPKDLEPMQALIDLWAANGTFPPESKAYAYANLKVGKRLLEMAGMA
ncbi:e6a588a8-60b2-41cc-ad44-8dddd0447b39 [Thermothielavioides terrestris]|uniref:E6a588a8-60b2-41cc-ad44-8dddd0447b39 n=1 Tax=Thermothielavioides terrestris TaxID=2587410 RepID=A0A3S4CZX3_9PEZI|nr:e6a588a8-60b2-41cc-ad44-8dddd0447b39 [Thermothielavioides terrestris]